MKLPLLWLKEYVSYSVSPETIAKKLTDVGLEVEGQEGDVLEINVTPNRGDALSILGLAREVSAFLNKPVKKPKVKKYKLLKKKNAGSSKNISIKITSKACSRYMLAVVKNVHITESPAWLKEHLESVGIRSINNVVDVTNYILMAYGQPLHAFDLNKIRGGQIIVRQAKEGELIKTLDAKDQTLLNSDLVISDQESPVALAGVMGGAHSEVTSETTAVALECAYFDSSIIRKTARRLGMQTDSSYRFERGINPDIQEGFFAALTLLEEVAQARVEDCLDVETQGFTQKKIIFQPSKMEQVIGGRWKESEFKTILNRLGFKIKAGDKTSKSWVVTVPLWRHDINVEEDLLEEIVRSVGLERIPATFPVMTQPPMQGSVHSERKVRELLSHLEFNEAIHFSFISPEEVLEFDPTLEDQLVKVANPLGHEFSVLRPTLLPSLLKTLSHHHRRKIFQVRLFELRNRFIQSQDGIIQRKALAGILSGPKAFIDWKDKNTQTDFFEAKGVVAKIMGLIGLQNISYQNPQNKIVFLHPGKQVQLFYETDDLGVFGELHPDLIIKLGLKDPVYAFELDWTGLEALKNRREITEKTQSGGFKHFSDQPLVSRDLALLMDRNQSAGDLIPLLKNQDSAIQQIRIFDVYEGEKLPKDMKSVAYSLELGLDERTMTDEEITQIMQKLMNYLKDSLGIEVR